MIDALAVTGVLEASIKASVLAVVVLAVTRLGRDRIPPRWSHALWLLVVVRALFPSVPAAPFSLFNLLDSAYAMELTYPAIERIDVTATPAIGRAVEGAEHAARSSTSTVVFAALWMAGVVWLLGRALAGSIRTSRALRASSDSIDGTHALLLAGLQHQVGVRGAVKIAITDLVATPAVHGLFRPTILLPANGARRLDDDELRHVILHELSHIRRGDLWISALLSVVTAIHWFNPLIWFAASRIREERELICDELALSCLEEDERPRYGTTLLSLIQKSRGPARIPTLVGIAHPVKFMKRRIIMVSNYSNQRRSSLLFAVLVAGVAAVGFTDARAGERVLVRKLAGDSHHDLAMMEKRASFGVQNASVGDLLGAISASSGIVFTQSDDALKSDAQKARFSVEASNVPVHVVLMETLGELGLHPKAAADGRVELVVSPMPVRVRTVGGEDVTIEEKRIVAGEPGTRRVIVNKKGDASAAAADEKHMRHVVRVDGDSNRGHDGRISKELRLNLDANGEETEGTLRITIDPAS